MVRSQDQCALFNNQGRVIHLCFTLGYYFKKKLTEIPEVAIIVNLYCLIVQYIDQFDLQRVLISLSYAEMLVVSCAIHSTHHKPS